MKDNRGITLVVLAITVIIMLVIAGIVFREGLRDDGTIDEARNLTKSAEESNMIEQIKMAILAEKNKSGSSTIERENIEKFIEKNIPSKYQWKEATIDENSIEVYKIKGILLKNGTKISIENIANEMNSNICFKQ